MFIENPFVATSYELEKSIFVVIHSWSNMQLSTSVETFFWNIFFLTFTVAADCHSKLYGPTYSITMVCLSHMVAVVLLYCSYST